MNYREQYAKKTAVQMYYQGAERTAVIKMLQTEGAGNNAERLADEYHDDFLFIQNHQKKLLHKSSSIYRTVGLVFIFGSLAYSLLTFIALDNGSFVVFSGLLVIGIGSFIKGLVDRKA
jgi:hypothetical protein